MDPGACGCGSPGRAGGQPGQSEPLPSRPDVADPACEPSLSTLFSACAVASKVRSPDNLKHTPHTALHKPPTPNLSLGGFPPNLDGKPRRAQRHAVLIHHNQPSPTPAPYNAEQRNPLPRRSSPRPRLPLPLLRRVVRCDLRFSARPQPAKGKLVSPPATTNTPRTTANTPMTLA